MTSKFRPTAAMAAVVACLFMPTAGAAERSYAILSLAGDSITTVLERPQTGSKIDQNEKTLVPIADKVFDEAAIQAINAAIKKREPDAKTVLLLTPDPGLYKAQNAMFESPSSTADDRTFLKSLLTNRAVTHLVLVTKARAEADIWISDIPVSTGRIEGLGYYMNNSIRIRNTETGGHGTGILAPFAYVKVRLIDAATLNVVDEVVQKKASPVGNHTGESRASWDVLTSAQKIDYLNSRLKEAVAEAVPRLIK
ncbi:hypothetical protein [Pseudoduganella namucuonensis]|uniref:Uncharacterized protein n=1 Tax=Pseudoduganella namucuonensis TaxID=1035707 RepID=A0A1I7FFT7_9BURK|nr:hypothetical protein [Pseudoduganella namucuonensis]SFU35039.1 hypothetical protein SAMN05216552_10028 [Pseudoduganella namucuonensis]